ncbi:hypothetical protein MTO96_039306 [Rhipicephalus appendiculatus]
MSSFFALAGWRSLGFLFVAIQETFQVNKTEGSWPIVIFGALGYMTGFITGPLAQSFYARPWPPTIISEHFVKNKGLAMGLNYAGITAALFVFPKLLEYLVAAYGLRGALLICGAVTMNGVAFSIFTQRPTWRIVFAEENLVSAKVPPKATGGGKETRAMAGIDRVTVATALSVMAAGAASEGIGRFTLPMAVDRSLLTNNVALMLTLGAEAVAFLLLPFLPTHGLIFAVAVTIGFIIGTAIVLFPVTLDCYFGHEKMSMAFGIVVASAGLQSFVRPSLIGHFRDKGGAYDWLFIICGVVNVVAAALWMVALAWESSRKKSMVPSRKRNQQARLLLKIEQRIKAITCNTV